MSKQLTKHLLQCKNEACGETFYVLNDSESESVPSCCPFCASPEIVDYVPVATPKVDPEEEEDE